MYNELNEINKNLNKLNINNCDIDNVNNNVYDINNDNFNDNDYKKYKIENQYLLAQINVYKNKNLNIGEKDEILLMMQLFNINLNKQFDKLVSIFGDEASKGIEFIDMNTGNIIKNYNFVKSKIIYKADCKIRMCKTNITYNISIKSQNGAHYAVINHTPRTAKIFSKIGFLYEYLDSLDKILKEYIDKRKNGIIHEDTSINNISCLKESKIKSDFINVLLYFIFIGSGKGVSKCPANSIINYKNEEIIFIKCENDKDKKTYIENILDKIIISLRDKGMPKNITDYSRPWIFETNNSKYKGSLHIRIN